MPKQTYYNLPEDKRERIVDAIRREFARVPAAKVSVNRIVCDAGISRGSFYQYFDDKDDLIRFVVNINRRHILDMLDALLQQSGDIFGTLEQLFDVLVAGYQSDADEAAFKNIYLSIALGDPAMSDERADVMELAHRACNKYGVAPPGWTMDEVLAGVDILYASFKSSLLQLVSGQTDPEQAGQELKRKMKILKKAVFADGDQLRENIENV